MQHLHLVGFTAELDGLIFSARRGSKSGGYVVSLDDRLLDAIREAVRLQTGAELDIEPEEGGPAPVAVVAVPELRRLGRVHSALSPKDIQARLRAGRSVAEVADEAEVDESWILRFASPVLAEQSRIVERALQLPCRANRKGESAEPLDVSVTENLIERGTLLTPDEISSAWSAYHVRDSAWVVRFRYVSRRRQQVAQWAFDLADLTLVPINRLATELGYVEPGRRKRRVGPPELLDDRRQPGSDEGAATMAPSSARPAAKRRASAGKSRGGKTTSTRRPAKAAAGQRLATRTGAARAATGTTKRAATGAAKPKASGAAKRTATGVASRPRAATKATRATKATKATKTAPARRPTAKPAKVPAVTRAAASRAPARKSPARVAPAATKRAGSPTKRAGAATKRAGSPIKRAGVATKRAGSPTNRAGVATKTGGAATKRAGTAPKPAGTVTTSSATKRVGTARRVAATSPRQTAARVATAAKAAAPKRAPKAEERPSTTAVTSPRAPSPTPLLVTALPLEPETTPVPNGGLHGAVPETVGSAGRDHAASPNGPIAVGTIPRAPEPPSSAAGVDLSTAEGRRQRPLVAVRANPSPVPLAERVIRIPAGATPGPDGNPQSTSSVVIQAVPAGEGMAPPTLEP